jgi:tRNA modification GTPase
VTETIFALSSGLPPAGIAVLRISGPAAGSALVALAGKIPAPRRATLARLIDPSNGGALDQALLLWFPGPASVTGEDLAELHLHGGRAIVAAVHTVLGRIDGLRAATAGEFTRRAFENGRIDLAEAEGLADLLAAETEGQRQSALALAEGALGRQVTIWQSALLRISALVEATLDFSDEGDVGEGDTYRQPLMELVEALEAMLASPPAERLKDGIRVVLAGPPNSGKSSLFNKLIDRDGAIVSAIAGTTRDRIEAPVVIAGIPLLLIDTAGLRDETNDAIEAIGIARTGEAIAAADILLWLGDSDEAPCDALIVAAKADLGAHRAGLPVSVVTGEGVDALKQAIIARAKTLLPKPSALALNARHRSILAEVLSELSAGQAGQDALIAAEHLRLARAKLDAITGKSGVEDMLDSLFGAFCIGK